MSFFASFSLRFLFASSSEIWDHASMAALHATPSAFMHVITKKLSEKTIFYRVNGLSLLSKVTNLNFCGNPSIPLQYLTELDREANNVNPTYSTWEVQDQMLLSWLESTLSSLILSRVLGSIHSYKVFGEDSRCLNIFYESKLSLILFLWLEIMCFFRSTSMLFSKAFRKSIAR